MLIFCTRCLFSDLLVFVIRSDMRVSLSQQTLNDVFFCEGINESCSHIWSKAKLQKFCKIHCKMDDTEEGPKISRWWKMLVRFAFTVQTSNCTKCDQLIRRKIIKIVATRCRISRIKCTNATITSGEAGERRANSDPDGEITALPRLLAGFNGAYF